MVKCSKSSLVKTLHEIYKKGIDYNEIKSVKKTMDGGYYIGMYPDN